MDHSVDLSIPDLKYKKEWTETTTKKCIIANPSVLWQHAHSPTNSAISVLEGPGRISETEHVLFCALYKIDIHRHNSGDMKGERETRQQRDAHTNAHTKFAHRGEKHNASKPRD